MGWNPSAWGTRNKTRKTILHCSSIMNDNWRRVNYSIHRTKIHTRTLRDANHTHHQHRNSPYQVPDRHGVWIHPIFPNPTPTSPATIHNTLKITSSHQAKATGARTTRAPTKPNQNSNPSNTKPHDRHNSSNYGNAQTNQP